METVINPHGLTNMSILWSFLTIREIQFKRSTIFKVYFKFKTMLIKVNCRIFHNNRQLIRACKHYNFDTSRSIVKYKQTVCNQK